MNTLVTYEGDGIQKTFTFPFPYLSPSHVKVFVNGALQLPAMNYTLSGNTITFDDAPGPGAAIEIKRQTSPNDLLVDFENGSTLRAEDLDLAYLHNFYLSQEYRDQFNKLINDALIAIAAGAGYTETEPDEVIAVIVNEMLSSAAAAALQQRVNDIDANAEAIVTLGESLQAQVNTLAQGTAAIVFVQPDEPAPGVGNVPDPIPDGARWYDSDDNNKPYIYDEDSQSWVSIEDPRIGQAVAAIDLLQTNVADNYAAILAEQAARSDADSALASTLDLLGAQNASQTAFILNSDTVKLDSDAGDTLANRFSQLNTTDSSLQAQITAEETARIDGDNVLSSSISLVSAKADDNEAAILAEQTTRANADSALASDISALQVRADDNEAAIVAEQTARANADSSLASDISSVNASVGSLTSTVNTQATAIANLESGQANLYAKYGVTLNVNGYVTGYSQHNDGESGAFVILADKFAVVDPSGDPGETEYVPFEIVNGKINLRGDVQIDGALVVNGTLNGAKIVSGGIGSLQLANSAVTTDKLAANAVTASKIAANAITAAHLAIDSDTGVTRTVFDPESSTPLTITDSVTGDSVFEIKLEGGKPKATVNGTAGEGFVSNAYAISDAVKKAINPYYSGADGSASATSGSLSSGGTKNFSIATNLSGKVSISFALSAFNHYAGPTNQNYTAPDWTVEIRRDSASGPVLFSKRYQGTASNYYDWEVSGEWWCSYNLSINDGFVDEAAPLNGSEVYYLKVIRHSGTPTSLTLTTFKGESPGFIENMLITGGNGYWKDKDTGLIIQWGSALAPSNGYSGYFSFPVAFPNAAWQIVGSQQVAHPADNDGDDVGADIVSKSQYRVWSNDNSATVSWIAIGY